MGYMASIQAGSVLDLLGEWRNDVKYGLQFVVSEYKEKLPSSVHGIEKYLGSGLIKGIGPTYAKKIIEYFKEDTFIIIDEIPDRLSEVDGIGKKRIEQIKRSWKEQKEIKNIIIFLQSFSIPIYFASKIFKAYKNDSIAVIKNNPYQLADDISGIGFKRADMIAEKLGMDKNGFFRCRSGILYTLTKLANDGHCYSTFEQLVDKTNKLLDIEKEIVIMTLSHMRLKKEIISENIGMDKIYLPSLFYSEVGVSKLIKKIIESPRSKKIKEVSLNINMPYDDTQIKAIKCAVNSKFMILTGGPGTGKTTTTIGIINVLKNNSFKVILAAPTGRAAKRLTETTGIEAKTIHRLLEYKSFNKYQKNEENPLYGDVLIIDESSMIDIVLMYNLLRAVPEHMSVILIGDANQLPSVGPGNVLSNIIESGIITVIKLKKIYRQAQTSNIIMNAHRVNNGEMPFIRNKNSDFIFIEENDDVVIPKIIVDLCFKRLPNYYNINPIDDIQVLCSMKDGQIGTTLINGLLQDKLNKNDLLIKYGDTFYRLNDKIMQIKNNYNKKWKVYKDNSLVENGSGIFNGDIGKIKNIDLKNKILEIDFDGRMVNLESIELEDIVLSYAVTVHKSQGSEFPIVIIPVSMSNYIMLQRNLIYTGITRAKKLLILVGSKEALSLAVHNNYVKQRNIFLKERLMN